MSSDETMQSWMSVMAAVMLGGVTYGALHLKNQSIDERIRSVQIRHQKIIEHISPLPYETEIKQVEQAKTTLSPDNWARIEPHTTIEKMDQLDKHLKGDAFTKFSMSHPSEYAFAIGKIQKTKEITAKFTPHWPHNAMVWYSFLNGSYQGEFARRYSKNEKIPISLAGKMMNKDDVFTQSIEESHSGQRKDARVSGSVQETLRAVHSFVDIAHREYDTARRISMYKLNNVKTEHTSEIKSIEAEKYGMGIPITAALIGLFGAIGIFSTAYRRDNPFSAHRYNHDMSDKVYNRSFTVYENGVPTNCIGLGPRQQRMRSPSATNVSTIHRFRLN